VCAANVVLVMEPLAFPERECAENACTQTTNVIESSTDVRWEAREPGEMDLAELQLCKRADGSDWVLGQGTFGTVRTRDSSM